MKGSKVIEPLQLPYQAFVDSIANNLEPPLRCVAKEEHQEVLHLSLTLPMEGKKNICVKITDPYL